MSQSRDPVWKDDRRGANRWRFRVWATNPFTKEKRRLFGSAPAHLNTRKAAEEAMRAKIGEFTRDPALVGSVPNGSLLVNDVAAAFLKHLQSNPELSESYVKKVALNLSLHIVPAFEGRTLTSIKPGDLRDFKLALSNKPRSMNGKLARKRSLAIVAGTKVPEDTEERPFLKARTVKDVLRCFHGLFVYAHDRELIPGVPSFPKPPKAAKTIPVFLTFTEAETLVKNAVSEDQLLFLFAIYTGLRAGEQMAFRWEDITWDRAREHITVRRAFKLAKLGTTKGKAERVLPIDPVLATALRDARHDARGKPRTGLVFVNDRDERLTHSALRLKLDKALKAAGIARHVRWHDLRHTFGSHAVMLGRDIHLVQAWMGHASVTTTEIYTHLSPAHGFDDMVEMAKIRKRILAGEQEAPEPAAESAPRL